MKYWDYTVCLRKKRHPFYICENFVRCRPILPILVLRRGSERRGGEGNPVIKWRGTWDTGKGRGKGLEFGRWNLKNLDVDTSLLAASSVRRRNSSKLCYFITSVHLFLGQVNVVNGGDNVFNLCLSVRALTVAISNRFWWNLAQTSGNLKRKILSFGVKIQWGYPLSLPHFTPNWHLHNAFSMGVLKHFSDVLCGSFVLVVNLLCEELNSYRYSCCYCCCACFSWGDLFCQKNPSMFQIGSGWNLARMFLHVNAHRQKESDIWFDVTVSRWRPWRHFTHQNAVLSPSGWKWNVCRANMQQARQFLICSIFVLVFTARCTSA